MKKRRRWVALSTALGLTALCVGAALATGGDQSDPLVTLSYLEQVALPGVVREVETKTATRQAELEQTLTDQIDKYQKEASELAASNSGDSASYTLVTLTSGQTMAMEVGCEVLLRVGTAKVNSNTDPALIDLSTGSTINAGTSLTKNHLYMATIPDRTLTPTAATVKVLVRGGYSVK